MTKPIEEIRKLHAELEERRSAFEIASTVDPRSHLKMPAGEEREGQAIFDALEPVEWRLFEIIKDETMQDQEHVNQEAPMSETPMDEAEAVGSTQVETRSATIITDVNVLGFEPGSPVRISGTAKLPEHDPIKNSKARVLTVIETRMLPRGRYTDRNPARLVTQYWSLDGTLLAEADKWAGDTIDKLELDLMRAEATVEVLKRRDKHNRKELAAQIVCNDQLALQLNDLQAKMDIRRKKAKRILAGDGNKTKPKHKAKKTKTTKKKTGGRK